MSYMAKKFDKYVMYYLGGKEILFGTVCAEIDCYDDNKLVGELFFIKENEILPSNSYYQPSDMLYFYYEISRFNDVATILRYEKPLSLWFETKSKMGYISTGTEPIGEQEGV